MAFGAVVAVALLVRLYEEPARREKFGLEYEEYCRHVRRWVLRMRGWKR